MNKEYPDYSDTEKFLFAHYDICPIHKKIIVYLRLADKEESQVLKCLKCLELTKFKRFVDLIALLESDNDFVFKKWPIHDNDNNEIQEKLEQIRREALKDLGQIDEISQNVLSYYKKMPQWEKLIETIKNDFDDLNQQNQIILNIINENQQNYESYKKQLFCLINEQNNNLFDLTKQKNIMNEALSQINKLSNAISIKNNDESLEEIIITELENLYKLYKFKKINIDFYVIFSKQKNNLEDQDFQAISNELNKCKNIIELTLDLSNNNIGTGGEEHIAKELNQFLNLITLNLYLENTKLLDQGVISISQSIENNDISVKGVYNIANQIDDFRNLNQLGLNLQQTSSVFL
ncbi:hypothetical protein ABPG72_000502 [Tetrahymena utriculariae]